MLISSSSSSSSTTTSRIVAFILFVGFASGAARLPDQELESLSVIIGPSLGKMNWSSFVGDEVNPYPCNKQLPPWLMNDAANNINCSCSYIENNANVCHVTNIVLKSLNRDGLLPPELVRLPFLEEIDLTRNYLNGTIPPEWGSMKYLKKISLLGNRLTGPIPKQLANIATLEELVLEANQFNGTIPWELGDLTGLKRLILSSNNLTGELPASLAKLTNLTTFRISDNNFNGSIPNYIQNWKNIIRIDIQGSGLSGPIPSNLTSLINLSDLRISDLNGNHSAAFPNLDNSTRKWNSVILRNCNIVGGFPSSIGGMNIDDLDLSFNKLTGPIHATDLGGKNIYLTGNSLNGTVPPDLMRGKNNRKIDLSYNNFDTSQSSEPVNCGVEGIPNLFANSKENYANSTGLPFYCVPASRCKPEQYNFFHINCGSNRQVDDHDHQYLYEPDEASESSNFFLKENSNWGYSSTGTFLNPGDYGNSNVYPPKSNTGPSGLYSSARLSPLSLTYYGFCLRNGNYTVNLHFSEIMFTNGSTFGSLGRRIFDVYIQGILVKKDYNIVNAAGGVNKAHIENFTAVVDDHTLEIRFYWAGKGTTSLPQRSVYGPLISAISVVHADYRPPAKGLSTGAIVGIVMAILFGVLLLVAAILWWKGCLGRKHSMHNDLKGLNLQTGSFTLRQIKAATNNFDPANKIGEGGFGPVYKGVLLDGTIIAVKQLSSKSKQGNREFVNEIGMISALQHPHLVRLYGCCIEGNQLLLVYEYMENNSLARALFGPERHQLNLDWPTRQMISIGIARGLAYLHEESRLKIVHRDIKATNVLLDRNLVPKISDFGLAKLDEEDDTHISTRIAGTFGYMAPEYAMRGYLTDKADVYSFGVVLLEIVSGRSNSSIRPKEERFYLLDWANSLKAEGKLTELIDQRSDESKLNKKEAMRAINIALLCTNVVAAERPSMSAVVSMLEGRDGVENLVPETSTSIEQVEMEAFDDGEGHTTYMEGPWTASSTSDADLYPLALDTSYWDKRS